MHLKHPKSVLLLTCLAAAFRLSHTDGRVDALSLHPRQRRAVIVPRGGAGPTKKRAAAVSGDVSGSAGAGTATIPNEVFNLVKSIVGAGVLSLPYGVAAFGNAPSALIPAVGLIAVMGALSAYTFGLIGRVCQRTKTESYSDAWDVVVGKSSSALIAFSCFIDCFAGNLSYSMILADTIVNLLATTGVAVTRTQSLLGVTGVVLLPLCLMKNLNSLAPFSLVGIMGMLYTTLAMGLRYFGKAYEPGGEFFASQLTAPIFGTAGAAAGLSPQALILMCMLSNAYIAHFNVRTELKDCVLGSWLVICSGFRSLSLRESLVCLRHPSFSPS